MLLKSQYETGAYKTGENGEITIEMWCFCTAEIRNNPYVNFKDVIFEDNKTYCQDWWELFTYSILLQLIPIGFVQITNVSATFLFIFLA